MLLVKFSCCLSHGHRGLTGEVTLPQLPPDFPLLSNTFWPLEVKTDLLSLMAVLTVDFNVSFDSAQGDAESPCILHACILHILD